MLTVVPLLERVRSSCDGQLVLFKGPEIARLYPGCARPFGDIDILVDDALAVRDQLVSGGFDEVFLANDTPDWHQLVQVFTWKGTRLEVDVHKAPKWPAGLRMPPTSTREVLDASVHSGLGVAGIFAPAVHHHALILAAHAWSHEPLWRLRDLIDIAVVSARRTSGIWSGPRRRGR